MHGSRSKIHGKNLVRQRCAGRFISGVKEFNNTVKKFTHKTQNAVRTKQLFIFRKFSTDILETKDCDIRQLFYCLPPLYKVVNKTRPIFVMVSLQPSDWTIGTTKARRKFECNGIQTFTN
jgi:hypothetical protein